MTGDKNSSRPQLSYLENLPCKRGSSVLIVILLLSTVERTACELHWRYGLEAATYHQSAFDQLYHDSLLFAPVGHEQREICIIGHT
ncbi:hypothetical protein BDV11DRAFT_192351, partial [Aspergillus similis]